jgi:subtilisin family serine protease
MSYSRLLSLAVLAAAGLGATIAVRPAPSHGRTIVTLSSAPAPETTRLLTAAKAQVVDRALRMWVVDDRHANSVIAGLKSRNELGFAQPVRTYKSASVATIKADPLSTEEWWRAAVGAEGLTPPGPGIPVTVVDSGVDLTHPEFVGRPDLTPLNPQEPTPLGGEHGTMVASLIGAPENGVGMVGIYPQAVIRSWDTALGEGTRLDSVQIAKGILAAARAGRGVVNLSLGGDRDLAVELAIDEATALGTLVVAASGNEGFEGSPLTYPAAEPHVLTVAATDRNDAVAGFSSRSPFVDVAAPGDEIVVASALTQSWQPEAGTSFSAPIVSGAAAWLWTVRPELDASQVAEIIRRSARDLGAPGRDTETGFGLLNIAAALVAPTPASDPYEPNDDTINVATASARNLAHAPSLTTKSLRRRTLTAREDRYEDPLDVYRVWIPARKTLRVTVRSSTDNDIALLRSGAPTAIGSASNSYRLAPLARTKGPLEQLRFTNGATGRWAFLSISLGAGVLDSTYGLTVRTDG